MKSLLLMFAVMLWETSRVRCVHSSNLPYSEAPLVLDCCCEWFCLYTPRLPNNGHCTWVIPGELTMFNTSHWPACKKKYGCARKSVSQYDSIQSGDQSGSEARLVASGASSPWRRGPRTWPSVISTKRKSPGGRPAPASPTTGRIWPCWPSNWTGSKSDKLPCSFLDLILAVQFWKILEI